VRRELELLEPVSVSILAQRRTSSPFGLAGGHAGKPGQNSIDGRAVAGLFSASIAAGQRLCIETPGGGGYGAPE
jgi:N-methylhydantoinase B/oxoprolinase/acetone carboxylase alpha subunit